MLDALETNGFVVLDKCIPASLIASWSRSLDAALNQSHTGTLSSRDTIYGSRNILDTWPTAREVSSLSLLTEVVRQVLGSEAGLVRTLFFDKPPGRSWSLPWHRDLTVAVDSHQSETGEYRCPTTKAGIPHVEAPLWLLRRMLTLRLHLDPMTTENGPLVVLPGSHRTNEKHQSHETNTDIATIHCGMGGILMMRPLLSHSSIHATKGNQLRRRILHFEFAAVPELTDGYQWHTFEPVGFE